MADFDIVLTAPLYRHLLIGSAKCFIDTPHEAFSMRIYRDDIFYIIGGAIHGRITKFFYKNFYINIFKPVRSE